MTRLSLKLSIYFQILTMTIYMKVLCILFITTRCNTVPLSRLKDLLNELDQYLTEIETSITRTTQVSQEDVEDQYNVNKRLSPLPWNKRLSSSSVSKRPLPPLRVINELEYRSKIKRLSPLPLDKKLPLLPANKWLLPIPENRENPMKSLS